MTFNLGAAKFILDAESAPLIAKTAQANREIQKQAEVAAQSLAKQYGLSVDEVKKAAAQISSEQQRITRVQQRSLLDQARLQEQHNARVARTRDLRFRERLRAETQQNLQLLRNDAQFQQQILRNQQSAQNAQVRAQAQTASAQVRAQAQVQNAQLRSQTQIQTAQIRAQQSAANAQLRSQTQIQAQVLRVQQQGQNAQLRAQVQHNNAVIRAQTQLQVAQVRAQTQLQTAQLRAQQQAQRQQARGGGDGGLLNLGTLRSIGSTSATLLGFGAIASGAVVAREAILSVTDSILKQEQAIRSLNAAFGEQATRFRDAANQQAQTFQRVNSEVQQGTAYFGILQKQYGITSDEIEKLIRVAINLQAAFGGELVQVFRDVSNAIQGEPQALEKYGIALQQNAIKNSQLLTAEEKRLFESMSAISQARIRLRVLFADADKVEGAAAERTRELAGAFDQLNRSWDNLGKVIGQVFGPQAGILARTTAGFLDIVSTSLNNLITTRNIVVTAIKELQESGVLPRDFGRGLPSEQNLVDIGAQIIRNRNRARIAAIVEAGFDESRQIAADERVQREIRLNQENERLRIEGEKFITALERSTEVELRNIAERKRAREAERKARLEALDEAQEAELRALEQAEQARQQASEAELRRIEAEKDARIQAAEDARDAALELIRVETEAAERVTDEQIRQAEIARDKRRQAAEDERDVEIKALEAQKEERDRQRELEDREVEDSTKRRSRALEAAHEKRMNDLRQEADAVRRNSERAIRAIERLEDREEDRHRRAIRRIDEERRKQTDAIDAQIDAIRQVQQARENAIRVRQGTERVEEARRALQLAQGIGTPEEVESGRQKLTAAIRLGDPEAVRVAQQQLVELAGRGFEEIEKARKDLFEAEEELRNENLKQSEDAEIQRLEAVKDSIDRQLDKEKQAEEDRNRRRRASLEADKRANKERAEDAIRRIEERSRKEREAYEEDKEALDDTVEHAKRRIEDRRRIEDQAHNAAVDQVRERYELEQREIKRTYDDEETGIIPALRRALRETKLSLEERERAAREAYEKERREIYETYDHPERGLISRHRAAEQAARVAYQNTANAIRDNYEEARKNVESAYRASDGKSGILDQLDEQERYTQERLRDTLKKWEDYKKDLVGDQGVITTTFQRATQIVDEFFRNIERRGGLNITINTPQRRRPLDPNPEADGGMGSTVLPPASGTQGPQVPAQETVNEVDMSPGRYSVSFGYLQPYNGSFDPGPGWQGKATWPGGPSHHKGVDLVTREGIGSPIGAFTAGTVISTHSYTGNPDTDPGGNYVVVESGGRTFWYMHLDSIRAEVGKAVRRGSLIGTLGWSGLDKPGQAHLHFEVRNGFNSGPRTLDELRRSGIDPMPYVRGYDRGYLFNNPTFTIDMKTGQKAVLAERGPERLLGREDTRVFDSAFTVNPIQVATKIPVDYGYIGSILSSAQPSTHVIEGDTLNYYGVAPEDVLDKWRNDQRRQGLLRGVRRLR